MTEDEVTAILGPPRGSATTTEMVNDGPTRTTKVLTWRQQDPRVTVTVTIRNGSVAGKNWKRIGPGQP
jgi:hypothetical protein